jgi:hypothetical protein
MPAHKSFWTAACEKHGTLQGRAMPVPHWIKVQPPKSKNERRDGGCPMCRRDRNQKLREQGVKQ